MKARSLTQWLGLGALALALALGATIVQAAAEPGTAAVRISDLNLASSEGVVTLYQRINSAATAVCAADPVTGSKLFGSVRARCVAASVAQAVAQVHSPALTTFHLQETAAAPDARRRGA